jgi:hypothetical protein
MQSIRIAELLEASWQWSSDRGCLNRVLAVKIGSSKMTFREYFERLLLTLQRLIRTIILPARAIWSGSMFSERWNFMTEPNNRVLARTGARILTQAEMAQVSGGFSTSMIITDLVTNFGQDFSVDHIEN